MSGHHFQSIQKLPSAYFGELQRYNGRKFKFRDFRDIIGWYK